MDLRARTLVVSLVFLGVIVVGSHPALADAPSPEEPATGNGTAIANETGNGTAITKEDAATATAADPSFSFTYVIDRTPDELGRVNVTYRVRIPNNVVDFVGHVPADATNVTASGFTRENGTWLWDGSTERPELAYTVPINDSSVWGDYDSVETASWAFFSLYDVDIDFRYQYSPPLPAKPAPNVTFLGEGHASDSFLLASEHEVRLYDAPGQAFTYVRPDAVSTKIAPGDVLANLSTASERLTIDRRDARVTVFDLGAPMRSGGAAYDASFWANTDGMETWYHEYVHTRQTINESDETYWFVEASADYFGGLLAWRQGQATAAEFRRYVSTTKYENAILSAARRGDGNAAEYEKGRRVLAALDYKLRAQSGGRRTIVDVAREVNARNATALTHENFTSIVADVAGGSLDAWLDRFVTTRATPKIPSDLADVLNAPPSISISGPATVTVGSPVTLRASASASGLKRISRVRWDINDDGVTDAVGRNLTHTFTNTGTRRVRVTARDDAGVENATTVAIAVTGGAAGANLTVTDVRVSPTTVSIDETITLTAVVENAGSENGSRNVTFTADGQTIETRTVTVAPGETITISTTHAFATAGNHTVSVGGAEPLIVSVVGGRLFENPLPGIGASNPPTNLDDDPQYEDVDGDGDADFDDAVGLAFLDASGLSHTQRDALDFDGDGDVDFEDAVALAFAV